MIDYIRIEGFKSLKQVKIKIKPVTILIGLNSSGKSSVIQFLQVLKQSTTANFSTLVTNGDLITLGNLEDVALKQGSFKEEKNFKIEFGIGGCRKSQSGAPFGDFIEYGYSAIVDSNGVKKQSCDIRSGSINLAVKYERGKPSERVTLPFGQGYLLFDTTSTILSPIRFAGTRGNVDSFDLQNLSFFTDILKKEINDFFVVPAIRGVNSPSYPLDSKASENLVDANDLNQQAVKLSSTVVYQGTEIEDKINQWINKITGITIRGRTIPDKRGSIEAKRKINTNIINEGFGSNQLVHLFAQIAMASQNSLIGIEEPEIHLHPKAQSELAKVLIEISKEEKKNLLITTHSEHILYRFLLEIARGNLQRENFVIYHFRLSEDGITHVEEVAVDEKGRLDGGIPDFLETDLTEFKDFLTTLKA